MSGELIGQQIGNYRLVRILGQGGFAEVYLGQHQRLPLQAAIKVLLARVTNEIAQHFQQEARTIATLQHPHIVRILDFDVQRGLPFLVMEYAPSGSLRQHHPRGSQLPISIVVGYAKQIAQALQYAHDHRFVHRDIKPENMLLDSNGRLVLSDFGIATMMQSADQRKQTVAGTTPYMAPEQLQGRPCAASDQYALGITIYEWLVGRPPFKGSATEVAMQHILTSPPPLRQYNPAISSRLEQAVLTALEKDVSRRYPRVVDFVEAFEAASTSSQRSETTRAQAAFSSFSDIPTPLFSAPMGYGTATPRFNSSVNPSSFFAQPSAERTKRSSMSGEENTDYAELCRQIESRFVPFGGSLVVRAPGCPDGTVIKLVAQGMWSIAPHLKEAIPGTRYAEIRRYAVGPNRFVSAAIFSELLPTQYVVWKDDLRMSTAVVYDRETGVVSL